MGVVVMVLKVLGRKSRDNSGARSPRDRTPSQETVATEIANLLPALAVERVPPRRLASARRNARRHSKRQIAQVAASIREFGFLVPIIVDEANTVIAGHGRLAAAELLDLAEVPIVRIEHLTEAQKRAYRLADNRLAELSDWDQEILALELGELDELELEFDLEITGFDTVDVDRLTESPKPAERDAGDRVPELEPELVVSQLGTMWSLGSHLLLCGDATDPETYGRLLGREKAQMVFTDPPYNVPIKGHVTNRSHREFAMASGEMSSGEFRDFLERVLRNLHAVSLDGAIHYVCMDWRHIRELTAAAEAIYGSAKQLCVWDKTLGGMGTFYRSQHELIFVYKVGDAGHINNFGLGERGRYRTNVWRYPGATTGGTGDDDYTVHPTVKPVAMVVDAIKDCSKRGGIVLDPFGGSGTTLIAAERTNRVARVAELDPAYVDQIVRRWQAFTGEEAVEKGSGKRFSQFEQERVVANSPRLATDTDAETHDMSVGSSPTAVTEGAKAAPGR
jgi:DNA modification methylase